MNWTFFACIIAGFCCLGSAVVRNLAENRKKTTFTSVGKGSSGSLNFIELLEAEKTASEGFFQHGRELLTAINEGNPSFELFSTVNDDADWNITRSSTYEDMASKIFYETRTTYTLTDNTRYINLDATPDFHAPHVVRELSDDFLVHCSPVGDAMDGTDVLPDVGAFIVGSTRGLWATSSHPHVSRFLDDSLAQFHPIHAASKREAGLAIARRVVATRALGQSDPTCRHLTTEPVHTFELFSKMRIESYVEHPFTHFVPPDEPQPNPDAHDGSGPTTPMPTESAGPIPPTDPKATEETSSADRKLFTQSSMAPPRPESLVTACTAPEWSKYDDDGWVLAPTWLNPFATRSVHNYFHTGGRYAMTGEGDKYKYELSQLNGGCMEYSTDNTGLSFLFNYDMVRSSSTWYKKTAARAQGGARFNAGVGPRSRS